jgi:pimeloyl-ACP methyl ester carboxylesterase
VPFFDNAGLRLQYFEEGAGEPVLLIHGWGGQARRQWHKVITGLRGSYRFFGLSLRGHGRSQEDNDPDYNWSALIDDCEALRRLAGVERWTVVGYSFGGLVALQYAAACPQQIRAACAVSPLIVPWWATFSMHYFRWPIAWLLRLARRLPPRLATAMVHNVAKTQLRTLFHTVEMMRGWKPGAAQIPSSVPVILIVGAQDRAAKSVRSFGAARPADVRVLADTGHFPLWKQRERFVAELADVLATYAVRKDLCAM